MLTSTRTLLDHARKHTYALGAFNIYNLEGVRAVLETAQDLNSPVMLQLHPAALDFGGKPLLVCCLEAARMATVPVGVHLDHSLSEAHIRLALDYGLSSIMADGSQLSYSENLSFTRRMAELVHHSGGFVEAELGRLSGTEDQTSVDVREACMTDPQQVGDFIRHTQIDALAVCIGNVHGHYAAEPVLDFKRLGKINERANLPLVLHGASGLPDALIRCSIELGICKFNVNTEVREAYVAGLRNTLQANEKSGLLDLMQKAQEAMRLVIRKKIILFGSMDKSCLFSTGTS